MSAAETRNVSASNAKTTDAPPPLVAVGERSADEQRRELAGGEAEQDDAEARGAGERERLPAERGQEGHVAEQRHRLSAPQQAEVAVSKRLEDAHAAGPGGHGFHAPKAILR